MSARPLLEVAALNWPMMCQFDHSVGGFDHCVGEQAASIERPDTAEKPIPSERQGTCDLSHFMVLPQAR